MKKMFFALVAILPLAGCWPFSKEEKKEEMTEVATTATEETTSSNDQATEETTSSNDEADMDSQEEDENVK